jgi:hypothetical protein
MSLRIRAALLTAAVLAAVASLGGSALAAYQPLTWTVVSSPNAPVMDNHLDGVSCAPDGTCTAVGFAEGQTKSKSLAESWNGTAWSIVPSPNRSAYNQLQGVSCLSASACTAVGDTYGAHSTPKTLAESWNGTTWSIVPSPNPSPDHGTNYLFGVSCVSATDCAAVGYHYRDTPVKTLAESWNGTTWSVVPSPNAPVHHLLSSTLASVSCTSATACIAVGSYAAKTSPPSGDLVESWDGTTWSVVPSPSEGTGGSSLSSVSCTSATACMAVGTYSNTGGPLQTFAVSWDGTAWSIVPTPNTGSAGALNNINSVSCTAAADCTAAGFYQNTSTTGSTLAEYWDGTSWSIVTTPNVGSPSVVNAFTGVSCASAATCVAAGVYNPAKNRQKTLTEVGTSSDARR